jgi:hypothetical protein
MYFNFQNKLTKDVKLQQKLTNLAKQALERAEILKGIGAPSTKQTPIPNPPSPPNTPLPTDVNTGLQSIDEDEDATPTTPTAGNVSLISLQPLHLQHCLFVFVS